MAIGVRRAATAAAEPPRGDTRKLALHWQLLIAIFAAILAGLAVRSGTTQDFPPNLFGVPFVTVFDYIGEIVLNGLKRIIVPLH